MRGLASSLYVRVCLINGLVFVAATTTLALSPATVSSDLMVSEAVILGLGAVVILATNALLLRSSLAPLDRLTRTMEDIDAPGRQRLDPVPGHGNVARLVNSFNRMAERLESERSRSNAAALAAQEAERSRIAQELHDEVGQSLTVVLLTLKRVADQAPRDLAVEVFDAQTATRSALDEVREVARRLRPGVLSELGLASALRALATDFSAGTHVDVRRVVSPDLPALSPDVELVVYRVAQEALTNVARHARARHVDLSLTRHVDSVRLCVRDDGVGVTAAGLARGTGLRGMRERAALVGASVEVRGGRGTTVSLVVPLAEPTGG